jgi:hypothetical protein
MGLNLDLTEFFGLSNTSTCPLCDEEFGNFYNDYDIETLTPENGVLELLNCCPSCEHSFYEKFKLVRCAPVKKK